MEKIDVLYTINHNYLDIMLTSLLSIIKNGNIKKIHCHIITSGFQIEDYRKLNAFLKKYNNIEINCYPLEQFDIEKFQIPNWKGSQIANARLFFESILGQNLTNIKQLLYLDADTMTVASLNDLNNYKNDLYATEYIGIPLQQKHLYNLQNYYNSGVLWIDVEKWTSQNYQDQLIHFIENNHHPLSYPDQDILNLGLKDKIKRLPREYNLSDRCFVYSKLIEQLYFYYKGIKMCEINASKRNPKIIHFYGCEAKPWDKGNKNPFAVPFKTLMEEINPDDIEKIESLNKSIMDQYLWLYYDFLLAKRVISKPIKKLRKRCF